MTIPTPGALQSIRTGLEEHLLSSIAPVIVLKVAREIAADIRPIDDILQLYGITPAQWEGLQQEARFRNALRDAVAEWQSVANTADRVRVKALAFVEEALPEFYARAHDPKEALSGKIEVFKTIAKIAGVAEKQAEGLGGARMSVTINLGADHKLTFEKDVTPVTAQVTEHAFGDDEDEL